MNVKGVAHIYKIDIRKGREGYTLRVTLKKGDNFYQGSIFNITRSFGGSYKVGDKVYIEGKWVVKSFKDKDGSYTNFNVINIDKIDRLKE